MLMNLKISLKLKISQVEYSCRCLFAGLSSETRSCIKEKNKEVERYKESAKTHLKNGNKFEAILQLKKKKIQRGNSPRIKYPNSNLR